ncbi:hypothetical protein, partial [Aeromonas veronii]|uniref:hypothetical protein n=1 Tax=Aeromonas veronii TaxID=654 RepID=UPI00406C5982
ASGGLTRGCGQRATELLHLIAAVLEPKRRVEHAGDVLYRAGEPLTNLHLLNSGLFKLISLSADIVRSFRDILLARVTQVSRLHPGLRKVTRE